MDVAGYVATGADGKPADRYAVVWAEKTGADDDARMVTSIAASELEKVHGSFKNARMAPMALSAFRGADGRTSYCGIWHKSATADAAVFRNDLGERKVPDELAQHAAITLIDLSVGVAAAPATTRDRASVALQRAEASLKAKPDDPGARFARASACLELGDYKKAIDDLDAVIKQAPQLANAFQLRSIAHARLGHKEEARADLARFQKSDSDPSTKLYLAVIVAAELGEGAGQAFEKLEAALKSRAEGPRSRLQCRLRLRPGLASPGQERPGEASTAGGSGHRLAQGGHRERLLRFQPHAGGRRPRPDPWPPGVWRDHEGGTPRTAFTPRCGRAMPVSRPIPSSVSIRTIISSAAASWSLEGYRMVSLSVVRTSPDRPPVTASVWHRPVVSEEAKDRLAERQARAAVALVRLGRANEVWTLLRHSADPRLRSFIDQLAESSGSRSEADVAELERLDHAARCDAGSETLARADRGRASAEPPGWAGLRPRRGQRPQGSRRHRNSWIPSSSTPKPRSAGP